MNAAAKLPTAVHAARGAVLAVAAASLGITAHILGDGTVPNAGLALLIGGLAGSAGLSVADRCRGVVAAVGALTAAQLILHGVLLVPSRVTHSHVAPVLTELDPTVERFAVTAEDIVQRALVAAGLRQPESKISADAQTYWHPVLRPPLVRRLALTGHPSRKLPDIGDIGTPEVVRPLDRAASHADSLTVELSMDFPRPVDAAVLAKHTLKPGK